MKKDWTKKCTCENFQQNEDCEHIGNKVLEEVGLGVGEKDCPDCLPYDVCAKHYIKNGDRHNRLQGALTPIECERLQSLPDNYTEGLAKTSRKKLLGNGFNCAVIKHIIKSIL